MKLQTEVKPKIEKAISLLKEVLDSIEDQRIDNNLSSALSKAITDKAVDDLNRMTDKQKIAGLLFGLALIAVQSLNGNPAGLKKNQG